MYREYTADEFEAVLRFVNREFTPRSAATWEGNGMTAMVAFQGERIVGVLPIEYREIAVDSALGIRVAWETAVSVHPEHRGRGIGSGMIEAMAANLPETCEGFFVYRQDETSPAYRWYRRTCHVDLQSIRRFVREPRPADRAEVPTLLGVEELEACEAELVDLSRRTCGGFGGSPCRSGGFYSRTLGVHYYRDLYRFRTVVKRDGGRLLGFAVLGETSMRSDHVRMEILEFVAPRGDTDLARGILGSVLSLASHEGIREVRISLSSQDPLWDLVQEMDFQDHSGFRMMGRLRDPAAFLARALRARGFPPGVELRVETPGCGEIVHQEGGAEAIHVRMHDEVLTRMALGRIDVGNAFREGTITAVKGGPSLRRLLAGCLPLVPWIFHQVDYI